jgi:hypothetical protein
LVYSNKHTGICKQALYYVHAYTIDKLGYINTLVQNSCTFNAMLGDTEIRKNQSTTRHMFKLGLATKKKR